MAITLFNRGGSMDIAELRELGCRVYIHHNRVRKNKWVNTSPTTKVLKELVCPKGGSTSVDIVLPNGEEYVGIVNCLSTDSYNKKLGVAYALERAISAMVKRSILEKSSEISV
jgi:hypothetical protein